MNIMMIVIIFIIVLCVIFIFNIMQLFAPKFWQHMFNDLRETTAPPYISYTTTETTPTTEIPVTQASTDAITTEPILTEIQPQEYKDGEYTGNFDENGKRSGQGKFKFHNGNTYVGEWKDDKYNGEGVYTWSENDLSNIDNYNVYVGHFSNGKEDGIGHVTFKNGGGYYGYWKEGERTTDKDKGEKSIRYGTQIYKGKAVMFTYYGEYSNGKYNGNGKIFYSDGRWYDGDWIDDHYTYGTYNDGKGNVYVGNFNNNNEYNGQGKLTNADGIVVYEGIWKNGEPPKK